MEFEWDEAKNLRSVEKHGIDFNDAMAIFAARPYMFRSDRSGEVRFLAIGQLETGIIISVACAIRVERIRIISARRSRTDEKAAYRQKISE